jgi:hypothetical protein
MAAFLLVMASVALLAGLVGIVVGHRPQTMGRRQEPRASITS